MEQEYKYLVATRCLTFAHASYIEDTLRGFVMQETTFPAVFLIMDDASTDGEQDILRRWAESNLIAMEGRDLWCQYSYGDVAEGKLKGKPCFTFLIILLSENHYRLHKSKEPYLTAWLNAAKYHAICEGDDYWTDPLKLQKQVDYLEVHPDCMLCVHAADWRTDERIYPRGCQEAVPMDYSVDELILCGGLYFATASFVCRTELSKDWPEWRQKASVRDFPLQILAGLRGGVHYLPDRMCVYRYRSEGSWTSNLRNNEIHIAFHKNKVAWMTLLDEATGHRYQRAIYDQLFSHVNALFNLHEISYREYSQAFRKSSQKHDGRLLKAFLRYYLEPVYSFLQRIKKSFQPKSHR